MKVAWEGWMVTTSFSPSPPSSTYLESIHGFRDFEASQGHLSLNPFPETSQGTGGWMTQSPGSF